MLQKFSSLDHVYIMCALGDMRNLNKKSKLKVVIKTEQGHAKKKQKQKLVYV